MLARTVFALGLFALVTVVALLALANPASAIVYYCAGGGSSSGSSYSSDGDSQHYESWETESCVARVSGTSVCAFYFYDHQYEADQEGSDPWEDHSTTSTGGTCV